MRAKCQTPLSLHDLFAVMIFGGAQLKLLIPHFLHCAVTLSLKSKYFPQHPLLKRPQSVVVVLYMWKNFIPIKNKNAES